MMPTELKQLTHTLDLETGILEPVDILDGTALELDSSISLKLTLNLQPQISLSWSLHYKLI